ncbi:MAG: O-acetyl-ADP-ribose deacetylase [Acidimicrobiales bacterium]
MLRAVGGDITTMAVDAVVNAANSSLMGGAGVDGAIHRAGGPAILGECRELVARQGGCPAGEAVATTAGELPARFVIHTVGPVFSPDRADDHDITLASAYRRSLQVAAEVGARTVAFPNISTGAYGFPKARAARVAVAAVNEEVERLDGIDEVIFVCHDTGNREIYRQLLAQE